MSNRYLSKRSNYTYDIEGNVLSIIDLDMGGMSVTNNIENICEQIAYETGIDLLKFSIIYRYSDGRWDGFDYIHQNIICINIDIEKLLS